MEQHSINLKNAASVVLTLEKSTSHAELFSVELKCTIDTLNSCFPQTKKPKLIELSNITKQLKKK